jgi:invasion protein IalB
MLQVTDQSKRQVLLVWILGRNAEGGLVSVMRTPTGVLLQKGVELKLGSGSARRLSYVSCDPQQCEAVLPMDDAMVREMAAGEAVATVVATDGRAISFNMAMKGGDKAVASIPR